MKDFRKANLGLDFEELINHANEQYYSKGIAVIQKVPTEWKVIRDKHRIISAFPVQKATVDYIGLYYNRPVAFDAKSTKNKTSFPLANIEDHQSEFLSRWRILGGKAFYLINFKAHNDTFILYQRQLEEFQANFDRKSIPFSYFENNCRKAQQEGVFVLHYLKDMF